MAKANGKKNGAVAESTNGANNGGLLFEAMPDDFSLPGRTSGGEWDAHAQKVLDMAPKLVKVYESEVDQETYSRAKSLRKSIARLKAADRVTVAVRKHGGKHVLFAQATEE